MSWEDFFEAARAGRFKNIYLFTGPEAWTKREAVALLRAHLLPAGLEQLNEAVLDGASAQRIIDSAETLPVMCDRRLVVVRDWAPLISGKGGDENADLKRMIEWMQDAPDNCTLVFYMSEDAQLKTNKQINALRAAAECVDFSYLSNAALLKWCSAQLKPQNKRISAAAVNEMVMMAGNDLTRIHAELGKLTAYTADRAEIEIDDIRAIVTPSIEYKVFLILETLLNGDIAKATAAANSALQGSNSTSLISLLSSQLRRYLYIKYVQEGRRTDAEAIQDLKLNPAKSKYMIQQTKRAVQRHSADMLKACYMDCIDADYAVKSGSLRDRAALDALMLKIAQHATKSDFIASNSRRR